MIFRILPVSLAYLAAGAFLGLFSAVGAIESVGSAPAAPGSIWQSRDTVSRSAGSLYGVAYYLLQGRLPASTNQTQEYAASYADDGGAIHANCVYVITGKPDAAHWWSLAAGTGDGEKVSASMFLTASDAVLNTDGTLTVMLSRRPMPGNWLRPLAAGRFSLIYTVAGFAAADTAAVVPPFSVKRTSC